MKIDLRCDLCDYSAIVFYVLGEEFVAGNGPSRVMSYCRWDNEILGPNSRRDRLAKPIARRVVDLTPRMVEIISLQRAQEIVES
jgi:hypothetical protein